MPDQDMVRLNYNFKPKALSQKVYLCIRKANNTAEYTIWQFVLLLLFPLLLHMHVDVGQKPKLFM